MKRIIICSDGTWNRPETGKKKEYPTNVLKFARGISPNGDDGNKQVVFYDWGIGSYHDSVIGGGFGKGLEKNVMDAYRFLVHNYDIGDEIYLFGFSRGAYTVRSLSGMMNNCSLLKSQNGHLVENAFALYKNQRHKPNGAYSMDWRDKHSVTQEIKITFVGAWDTVGSMGLPKTFFGLTKDKHLFFDNKMGSNILKARHALSLDEKRNDFEPTIWEPRDGVDLKQVWFAGCHSDIGGSYPPDKDDSFLSDIALMWMMEEAHACGLTFEAYFKVSNLNANSKAHSEYKRMFKLLGKYERIIPDLNKIPTKVHRSVKKRYETSSYASATIEAYLRKNGGVWPQIEG